MSFSVTLQCINTGVPLAKCFVAINLSVCRRQALAFWLQVFPAQAAQGEEGKRPDPGLQRGVPAVRFVVELRLILNVHTVLVVCASAGHQAEGTKHMELLL